MDLFGRHRRQMAEFQTWAGRRAIHFERLGGIACQADALFFVREATPLRSQPDLG